MSIVNKYNRVTSEFHASETQIASAKTDSVHKHGRSESESCTWATSDVLHSLIWWTSTHGSKLTPVAMMEAEHHPAMCGGFWELQHESEATKAVDIRTTHRKKKSNVYQTFTSDLYKGWLKHSYGSNGWHNNPGGSLALCLKHSPWLSM